MRALQHATVWRRASRKFMEKSHEAISAASALQFVYQAEFAAGIAQAYREEAEAEGE